MTTTLAFDTSQQWCSVAVSKNGNLLAHGSNNIPGGHTQTLLPLMVKTLHEANLEFKDVDIIVTITGPGSFTGLRVSMATAQGLGAALTKAVIGIDSFTAYAACISTHRNILVVLDSQKQDIYCQLFSPEHLPLKEAIAIDPAEIATYLDNTPLTLTGTATGKITPVLERLKLNYHIEDRTPDDICQRMCLQTLLPEAISAATIQPFYLKEAIVGQNSKA